MDAYEAEKELYELTRDALKLAEMAEPYKEGEQWAVNAVLFLRRETVLRKLRTTPRSIGETDEEAIENR